MTISQYIDSLRAKPEHIRQRITVAASAGVTGLVAFAWVGTLAATGAFSLDSRTAGEAGVLAQVTPTAATAASTKTNFNELVGAVGAGLGATANPTLVIEDNGASSTLDRAAPKTQSATVLTF